MNKIGPHLVPILTKSPYSFKLLTEKKYIIRKSFSSFYWSLFLLTSENCSPFLVPTFDKPGPYLALMKDLEEGQELK